VISLARFLIRLYQRCTPPQVRGACRFTPTCSEYALQAIEQHGVWRGLPLALRRLMRCHPLGSHGWDPVP
jgi:putative membrane protein insertion efficiency factor